jgi:hypothetical protein
MPFVAAHKLAQDRHNSVNARWRPFERQDEDGCYAIQLERSASRPAVE